MPTQEELRKGFTIGDWEVFPGQGLLRCGDSEERPEPMVFEVLMVLAARDGDLVTRDELIDKIWGGRATSDEPINRCLSQLRGHLSDRERPYRYIETLTRRGYRLNQKVRLHEPAAPDGDELTKAEHARNQGRLWMLVGIIVVTVLIAAVIRSGLFDDSLPEKVRSVAVLPFDNLSGNENDQYLVSGFKEELVLTLHAIPDLAVKHGRVSYPDLEVAEIAEILGVDAVLFGSVQRENDVLKISYHIADRRTGLDLSAGNFTGKLEGIFGLQERLALMVRNDLLGESPQQLISASRPANFDAYDRYMRGIYAFERRSIATAYLEDAIGLFEDTIRLDPQFGPAYLSLATAYAVLPDYEDEPLEEWHRLAVDTVERGVSVDDSIRDAASAVFGFVYHKQRKWAEAERAYIRAINGQVVDSNAFNWYARMLGGVGRREDALQLVLTAYKLDPSSAVINSLVAVMYTWLNDAEKAAEFFERSNQLGASGTNHLMGQALLKFRERLFDESRELAREGAILKDGAADWADKVFAAMKDPARRAEALAALDGTPESARINPRIELTLRAALGDVDGALRVANSLALPGEHDEIDVIFLPELRPLREHPGFFDLMENLGVQDYWDEKGCVWLDDSVSCPD
jgi:DNA-binding winged helix-turn-helix (wHTH) protein/TolB-like protein